MGYTYAQLQTAIALEMVIPNANVLDANFQLILPTIIDYAEQRCYRELDLLYATSAQTVTLQAGVRTADLSGLAQYVVIVSRINVITPSSVTDPDLGSRHQVTPVSEEWMDAVYGWPTPTGIPTFFAMQSDTVVLLGPWPDQAYTVEVVGVFRPTPIYDPAEANGTWLSLNLPDLFLAACMVSASGYRHNFGAQADDPKMAVSWETQFQTLLSSAKNEETRKKFRTQTGSSESTPSPNP